MNETTDPSPTGKIKKTSMPTSSSEDDTFLGANSTVNLKEDGEQTMSSFAAIVAVTVVSLVGMTLVISFVIIYRRKKR